MIRAYLIVALTVIWALASSALFEPRPALPTGWETVRFDIASHVRGASGPCQVCPDTASGDPLLNADCPEHADCTAPCTQRYGDGGTWNGCQEPDTFGCTLGGKWNQCIWARNWWCSQGAGAGTGRCGNDERCRCIVLLGGKCQGSRQRLDLGTPCKQDCM